MPQSTAGVLSLFEEIASVPRESKHEEKIRAWLLSWAVEHQLSAETDEVGNVLIRVPATSGQAEAPVVVLQGHMDMVCEKRVDSSHNFSTDPIKPVQDGEWLRAQGTTLGADNGIAIALALSLAVQNDIDRPPLELLFTVDEESALTGATQLRTGWLTGKILLNLDSEDEGYLTVGCAGGKNNRLRLKLQETDAPADYQVFEISVGGLAGGHSGVDITRGRGNANLMLARVLYRLHATGTLRLCSFKGGNAHNAIPRDATATVLLSGGAADQAVQLAQEFQAAFRREHPHGDPNVTVSVRKKDAGPARCLTESDGGRVLRLLLGLPNGIRRMSPDIPDLVETSCNLATVTLGGSDLEVLLSQRSSLESAMDAQDAALRSVAALAGATVSDEAGYPGWEPNMESELLARMKRLYRELFGNEPVVEAVHAGLEAGVIGAKYPGMEMISLGPTIENPHSPDERLHIQSVEKVRKLLVALLASYCNNSH